MVFINVFGVFHAFELAKQVKKSQKTIFFTSYPSFYFRKNPIKIFSTNLGILNYLSSKYLLNISVVINKFLRKLHYFFFTIFFSPQKSIIISWGFTSKYYIKKLISKNNILIIERGSTHPLFQKLILEEEYSLLKIKNNFLNDDSIQLQEYEYKHANYISVPSDFVKKTFLGLGYPSEKLFVNPYGCDLTLFKSLNNENNNFRIIFVGEACVRKGFHYLIEAMKLLKDHDIELWHLGTIDSEIKTFDYMQGNIKYHGSKPKHELYKYYNDCDVFVLPSLEEGLAMVTLQAMACGLPVICTPNTGIENILTKDGKEGFLIPIRDPHEIANKVLQLYNDRNLKAKMGKAALKRVKNGFTWDDYGKRYIDFLKKIQNE